MSANNVIGIPANDPDFEEKCVPLFAGHVHDPNFKRVATRGKNQSGIDLIGARDRDPLQPVGVQCKLKTKGDKLSETEVRSDVGRALQIRPALTEIYVVTTASDDLAYDTLALTLRGEQQALGRRVDIQIWGWDHLQTMIRRDAAALNAFDPNYSASTATLIDITTQTLESGREAVAGIAGVGDQAAEILQKVTSIAATISVGDPGGRLAVDALLNAQVDQYRDLLNQGKPRTAMTMLDALEQRLTDQHSGAIRARVRANRGFAHLKLGDEAQAGRLLVEAYDLDPGDQKIRVNRLLGLALTGEPDRALEGAREMLAEDPSCEGAASIAYGAAELARPLTPTHLSRRNCGRLPTSRRRASARSAGARTWHGGRRLARRMTGGRKTVISRGSRARRCSRRRSTGAARTMPPPGASSATGSRPPPRCSRNTGTRCGALRMPLRRAGSASGST